MSIDPITVECPSCLAGVGRDCVWVSPFMPAGTFHDPRVDRAYGLAESTEPMPPGVIEKALEDLV